MQSHLKIEIFKDETKLNYIDNGRVVFSFKYPIGLSHFDKNNWDNFFAKRWHSYILWTLHSISYMDRIPIKFIVSSSNNVYFFVMILKSYKYVEFFTFNKNIHVIISEDKDFINTKHARYKKAVSSFKV
jgi:hypothetical protein